MRTSLAAFLGRLTARLLRVLGRSGTTVPGRAALSLDPRFVANRRELIEGPVALISATNGKTTTSKLVARAMARNYRVVGNFAGANMSGGVASSLVDVKSEEALCGVFEVDEFWLNELGPQLSPTAILLGNLFRDQLDRYGELDTILERWHAATSGLAAAGTLFVACADDPGIVWVLRDVDPAQIVWFGCDAPEANIGRLPHAADSGQCRRCGEVLTYQAVYLGHLGDWKCSSCGLSRPELALRISSFNPRGAKQIEVTITSAESSTAMNLPLPGLYNAYNAVGAWGLTLALGADPKSVQSSFEQSEAAFGRGESIAVDGTDVQMLLIKNPTGANEVIRALRSETGPLTVLFCLNDGIADGRDVSWIWDTDFEDLVPVIGKLICSGTRAEEAALRFRYAGVQADLITTEPELRDGLTLASVASDEVWVLPTYTAMLELRAALASEGLTEKVR